MAENGTWLKVDLQELRVDYIGLNSLHADASLPPAAPPYEVRLRFAGRAKNKRDAVKLAKEGNKEASTLADLFCRAAEVRIDHLFADFYGRYDGEMYRIAQQVMKGEHAWLESGIIDMIEREEPGAGAPAAPRERAVATTR